MSHHCESCGMPIDNGRYCPYCINPDGQLQDFDTRFERMVAWAQRENPALSRVDAESNTLAYMRGMPAWANHPRVVEAGPG